MLKFLSSFIASAGWAAALGPFMPIMEGVSSVVGAVLKAVGAVFSAVFEIVSSLSKSPEGRVTLAIVALGLGFLFARWHYVEQGRAGEQVASSQRLRVALANQARTLKCPAPQSTGRRK